MSFASSFCLACQFFARGLFRSIFLFPYALSFIVTGVIWRWIFNNQYGVANYLIVSTGLTEQAPIWLGPDWIFWTLVGMAA